MEPRIVSGKSLGGSSETREWNWVPLALAAVLIGGVVTAGLVLGGLGKRIQGGADTTSLSAAPDPYAEYLPITKMAMSESSNLAGGKVTYLDGHIANVGSRTVTEVIVRVLFRNAAHEVAQSERMSLMLVRMREPYIDTVMVSAAPLKPGAQQDFRFNFDAVSPDWAGGLPEVQILHVESK